MVQSVWVPAIRAQVELTHGNPAQSIALLRAATRYELSNSTAFPVCMFPVYIRGQAYLAARQGTAAAAEFQRILDHRGLVWNCWTSALAQLGLARAYALVARTAQGADAEGYKSKSRAAYQDFLTLWKDADPDIPIFRDARAEAAAMR